MTRVPLGGIDRIVRDRPLRETVFGDRTVALVTNDVATTASLERSLDALVAVGVRVTHVLGPEHGLHGTGQAGESEATVCDERTGLPVLDTYSMSADRLTETIRDTGAELVAIDLVDVGARLWTYPWTTVDVLVASSRAGVPVVVLDRPNPLGGRVAEGPALDTAYESFVGRLPIPLRHGLTMGEIATTAVQLGHAGLDDHTMLEVVTIPDPEDRGVRHLPGSPWVAPSPNLPTLDTALLYPGMCLVEGSALSEGRGTTRPFEVIGAPWVDDRFVPALADRGLPGVRFRETHHRPTFHKYAGETVHAAFVHIVDRVAVRPVLTAVTVLEVARDLYPERFGFRAPSTEAGTPQPSHPIDLLWGSDTLRTGLEHGEQVVELVDDASAPTPAPPLGPS
ncbi:DUF1343 domain-containing protein [Curtobacterium sp. A7_M15]|uniref:exo-beta-N-acetylmuramidase NamZ family protein n=1 Tax=Curtobacterium sp. A7_M15 TaxID=3065241 RepID=UPI002737D831|nr:DUF1343 domain-containing protein [Curtobacterium sp. A7_M15]MDP4331960.1 DUF1343 domain-containing protein [Curtobacterium sp. A7_M15]